MKVCYKLMVSLWVSYCAPLLPFLLGGLSLQPNFQKGGGGLAGSKLLEGVAGNDFFQGGGGGLQFSHK